MRKAILLTLTLAASPAFSQDPTGDAAAGEAAFRQCQSCHVVRDPDGNTLAGRNGRTGPNLYGISGRAAGSVEDFRYSAGMQKTNEAGLVWDEEAFVAFVQNPTDYIREATGDDSLRSNMTFRVRKPEDAANLWAYLVSLSPTE